MLKGIINYFQTTLGSKYFLVLKQSQFMQD